MGKSIFQVSATWQVETGRLNIVATTQTPVQCVNCERSVDQVPLIAIVHRGGAAYICPQCLPILIHEPQALVGKLAGAESLQPRGH